MSEKKKDIESGKNVVIDDITVINNLSLSVAEKQEEKKQEEVSATPEVAVAETEETATKDEIKPDVVVSPEDNPLDVAAVADTGAEEPEPSKAEETPEPSAENAAPSIDLDSIVSSLNNDVPPQPDIVTPSVVIPDVQASVDSSQDLSTPKDANDNPMYSLTGLKQDNDPQNSLSGYNQNGNGLEKVLDYIRRTNRINPTIDKKRENTILKTRKDAEGIVSAIFKEYPSDAVEQIIADMLGDHVEALQLFYEQLKKVDDYCTSRENHEKDSVLFELYNGGISIKAVLNPDTHEINQGNSFAANDYNDVNVNSFNQAGNSKFNDDHFNNGYQNPISFDTNNYFNNNQNNSYGM